MKRVIAVILTAVMLLLPVSAWGAVPPDVVRAYADDGGRIVYRNELWFGGTKYWGLYYLGDRHIEIALDAPDMDLVYAHEIGHWIYHKQIWSGELQDMADRAFASSPLRECNDENFAVGYSMYCCRGLGGELADFYREIEQQIMQKG